MNHQPSTLKPAEYGRTVYSHAVAKGNDYEKDVLNPAYFGNFTKLKVGDRIEVLGPKGDYFAELYVVAIPLTGSVQVAQISFTKLKVNAEVLAPDADFEVKFRGPRKWSIVRTSDSKVLQEDIATQEEAIRDLADYKKALAA